MTRRTQRSSSAELIPWLRRPALLRPAVFDWAYHDQKPELAAGVAVYEAPEAGLFEMAMVNRPARLAPGKFS